MRGLHYPPNLWKLIVANMTSAIGSGITGVAVPWMLIAQEGGKEIYGWFMLGMTGVSFLLAPWVGVIVDRFRRRNILMVNQLLGIGLTLPFAIWGMLGGEYGAWHFIIISAGSFLYYTIHYPTQFAFVQLLVSPKQYTSVNSVLEVQGQAGAMISGGLSVWLIEIWELSTILFVDAMTFGISFLMILLISFKEANSGEGKRITWLKDMKEGFQWLRHQPKLTFFLLFALFPFLGVMAGNYLNPIFVQHTLGDGASTLAGGEMVYAVGAVLAGFSLPFFIRRMTTRRIIRWMVVIFAIATWGIAWFPITFVFLAMELFQGLGNAGTRIARNTLIMEWVPNAMIGRVHSFLNGIGYLLRMLILGSFTQVVVVRGASYAYMMLAVLMTFAAIAVLGLSGWLRREPSTHVMPQKAG
ncbi:MFS transporter [Marininema halotolerans]|uniref:Major Facilitator Superfamily protein n=1 Tax=Marininema halotolerans TaxID=1155944 RepID=A0A1I6QMF6_9BACL|nr:MFS transporter [Marininema halotolerans]SFS53647.1 Major Facilitator Superfamily protein [Marininema halotolerans]